MLAKLTIGAVAGLVLGLIAVAVLRPQTAAGAVFVILLFMLVTGALGSVVAARRGGTQK